MSSKETYVAIQLFACDKMKVGEVRKSQVGYHEMDMTQHSCWPSTGSHFTLRSRERKSSQVAQALVLVVICMLHFSKSNIKTSLLNLLI